MSLGVLIRVLLAVPTHSQEEDVTSLRIRSNNLSHDPQHPHHLQPSNHRALDLSQATSSIFQTYVFLLLCAVLCCVVLCCVVLCCVVLCVTSAWFLINFLSQKSNIYFETATFDAVAKKLLEFNDELKKDEVPTSCHPHYTTHHNTPQHNTQLY